MQPDIGNCAGSLFTLRPRAACFSPGAEDAVSALWVDLGLVATEPVSKLECLVAGAQIPAHPKKTSLCLRKMLSELMAEQDAASKGIACVCGSFPTLNLVVGGARSGYVGVFSLWIEVA